MKPVKIVKDSLGRECPDAFYIEDDGMIEVYIEFDNEEDYQLIIDAAKIKGVSIDQFINDALREFIDKPEILQEILDRDEI